MEAPQPSPPQEPQPSRLAQQMMQTDQMEWEPETGQNSVDPPTLLEVSAPVRLSGPRYTCRVFSGHREAVWAVALSPDGQTIASGSDDRTIRLWTLQGEPIGELLGHGDWVNCLTFTPDGQRVISGSADGMVRIWEVATRSTIAVCEGHKAAVNSVACSPDGQLLVSGGRDSVLCYWDMEGNLLRKSLEESRQSITNTVRTVKFSPQGDLIASGGWDSCIRLWDLQGQPLGSPLVHQPASVFALDFLPNGQAIVSGGSDGILRLWTVEGALIWQKEVGSGGNQGQNAAFVKGGVVPRAGGSDSAIHAVAVSADGQTIATGSNDGTIQLWTVQGERLGEPLQSQTASVEALVFSPDGQQFVSGSADGAVRLWGKVGKVVVPQSLSNDLAIGEDRLFIKDEVDALASVLMLRQLQPPLAVGILGNWGSGKSFVMHLIQQQLNTIRAESLRAEQAWGEDLGQRSPYVGHIYQIRFDAWSYAKTNLWASLMETILTELNRQIGLEQQLEEAGVDLLKGGKIWETLNEMGEEQRHALLNDRLSPELFQDLSTVQSWQDIRQQSDRSAIFWERLSHLRRQDAADLEALEQDVSDLEKEVQVQLADIETQVDQKLTQTAREQAMKPLEEVWFTLLGQAAEELRTKLISADPAEVAKVKAMLEELDPQFFQMVFHACRQNPWTFVAFLGAIALAAATPILIENFQFWGDFGRRLVSLSANMPLFAVGFPLGQKVWTTWKQHQRQVKEVWNQYQARVQVHEEKLRSLRQSQVEKLKKESKTEMLERKLSEKQADLAKRRSQMGLMVKYGSLTEFVTERLQGNAYQEHLGLIHQVRRDMEELSDRLVMHSEDSPEVQAQKRKLFPRGDARVVLYIDDLDRCPPDRVVAVLEAVQLLLKTPLFIVVLAIDDRYIARALEDVYRGVLKRRGKPSGIDYLEKIIQIPYRMRPISPINVESYLSSQVEMQGAADPVSSQAPIAAEAADLELTQAYRSQAFLAQELQQESQQEFGQELGYGLQQELQQEFGNGLQQKLKQEFGRESRDSLGYSRDNLDLEQSRDQDWGGADRASITPSLDLNRAAGNPQNQGSGGETLGDSYLETIAEVTALDSTEFQLLVNCCNYVDITPRTAKRLINIYKILKIIWAKRGEPKADLKQVVIVFLALSARYPDLMRDLLGELDAQFEEQGAEEVQNPTLSLKWGDLRQMLAPQVGESNLHLQREWRRFESDVCRTLGQCFSLDRATFYLVLSFCFVGDIGYDP
ncbi:MAG: P-loop NTPase fold protein, partial [Prochlorothrix sp.]